MMSDRNEIWSEDMDSQRAEVDVNLPDTDELISGDKELWKDDVRTLTVHNEQYSRLLSVYVDNISDILKDKREKKNKTYKIAFGLLIAVPIGTFIVIIMALYIAVFCEQASVLEILPEVVVAAGAFIVTLMTIPNLISEYLFNKEEEQTMSAVIGKIQDYDIQVRKRNDDT